MKRKVASRKLKRKCFSCGCNFKKGDVYYKYRDVYSGAIGVLAYEWLMCPKCKYKMDSHLSRLEQFKKNCHHPIVNTVWTPISGEEWRYEPDHDECLICGEWL